MTEYERESSSSTKKVVHRDQKPGGALAEFVVSSSEFLPFEIEEPKKKEESHLLTWANVCKSFKPMKPLASLKVI